MAEAIAMNKRNTRSKNNWWGGPMGIAAVADAAVLKTLYSRSIVVIN